MDADILKSILSRFYRKMGLEKRKVILFSDFANCYALKHCFKKCGFDVWDMSYINEEIDIEFKYLFTRISSETTINE